MKIAVTGGIGSGKSTLVKMLQEELFPLYRFESIDEYVQTIWADPELWIGANRLKSEFGTTDRKEISDLAFKSTASRKKVEEIFAPTIQGFLDSAFSSASKDDEGEKKQLNIVIEFPLLFEMGTPEEFDMVIVVTADQQQRVNRVKKRSGWAEDKINAAISAQSSDDSKLERAKKISNHHIIRNNADERSLRKKVIVLANKIKVHTLSESTEVKKIGLVAGSFDPITLGHEWLIQQATKLVDTVIVVLAKNPAKKYYLTEHQRNEVVLSTISSLPPAIRCNVCCMMLPDSELLVKMAEEIGAQFIFRGIRNHIDFEYENQLNLVQRKINPEVNIVYLLTPRELTEVSSSLVKQLMALSDWEKVVKPYVSAGVFATLLEKSKESKDSSL